MSTPALLVISPAYSMREMLARYLSSEEFTVYTADSVTMALPLIPLQPQVVIYDLELNQASGLDLMCWLNHRYPAMHQVILCDTSDTELMQLLKSQRVSVLNKNNFNLMHFRSLLQTLCRHPRGLFQETDMGQEAYYTISSGLDQLMALSALKIDQQDGVKMPLSHGTILAPDMALVNHFVDAYPEVELELFYTASVAEALEQVSSRADFLVVDLDLPELKAQLEQIDTDLTELEGMQKESALQLLGASPQAGAKAIFDGVKARNPAMVYLAESVLKVPGVDLLPEKEAIKLLARGMRLEPNH